MLAHTTEYCGVSVGVSADGNVSYNGLLEDTFENPELVESYGIAVDYTGTTPVVHSIIKRGREDYEDEPAGQPSRDRQERGIGLARTDGWQSARRN